MTKPPFLDPITINKKVQELFKNYEVLQTFPVDIDTFIECDLGIEIIPTANLKTIANIEAMITMDFSSILVDSEYFNNDRMKARMNFSLAHELGHFFFHQKYLENLNITTEEKWFELMSELFETQRYNFLEFHANTFAGLLLVPGEELIKQCQSKPHNLKLSRYFGVSTQVIQHRITAEDVIHELEKIYLN